MNKNKAYEIKTVAIIGLGALGILFGHHLSRRMPYENFRIIADIDRVRRYEREKLFCNGELCDFHYMTPDQECEPADLIIFTVKYQGLQQAIDAVRKQVGDNTIILSALNGITSEEMIGEVYGMDKILYCVAQGMDAVKEGNHLTYDHMGMLVFGEGGMSCDSSELSIRVQAVTRFFNQMKIPHKVDQDMNKRMWGKFMLNVGVNQTVAVIEGNYGDVQKDGEPRDRMIAAMREVITLSEREGINLSEEDLYYWLGILGTLNPEGKPSMRQDLEARRYSEVELFAGTVLKLGKKHHRDTPVNQELYDKIITTERLYKNI